MPPRYIYQRRGGPLVQWNRLRPPGQSKGADAQSLGSLGSTDVFDKPRRLPRGGAPEYIDDGLSGCACAGGLGCSDGCKCAAKSSMGSYVAVGEYVGVGADEAKSSASEVVSSVIDKVGPISAVYHGYKRNESIGWALAWGLAGLAAPLLTNVIAVAQGYGKKK